MPACKSAGRTTLYQQACCPHLVTLTRPSTIGVQYAEGSKTRQPMIVNPGLNGAHATLLGSLPVSASDRRRLWRKQHIGQKLLVRTVRGSGETPRMCPAWPAARWLAVACPRRIRMWPTASWALLLAWSATLPMPSPYALIWLGEHRTSEQPSRVGYIVVRKHRGKHADDGWFVKLMMAMMMRHAFRPTERAAREQELARSNGNHVRSAYETATPHRAGSDVQGAMHHRTAACARCETIGAYTSKLAHL
eukprot:6193005-Pleurochrysis_carterae.AAC.2